MAPIRNAKGHWVKGSSGNPKGRAPKSYEEKYLGILRRGVRQKDWRDIVQVTVARAKAGDWKAREWLGKYLLPTQEQILKLIGDTDQPLNILLQWDDDPDDY